MVTVANPLQNQLEKPQAWVYEGQEEVSREDDDDICGLIYYFFLSLFHCLFCSDSAPSLQSKTITVTTKEKFTCSDRTNLTAHDLGLILQRCNYPWGASINAMGTQALLAMKTGSLNELVFTSNTTTTKHVSILTH